MVVFLWARYPCTQAARKALVKKANTQLDRIDRLKANSLPLSLFSPETLQGYLTYKKTHI